MPVFQGLCHGWKPTLKKKKSQGKISVKINLKFQMEENYKHIRKYPSGCCCILPSCHVSPEAAAFWSPGQWTSGLPAVLLPWVQLSEPQPLGSSSALPAASRRLVAVLIYFSSWIQSYLWSSPVEKLTASEGSPCHWFPPIHDERLGWSLHLWGQSG